MAFDQSKYNRDRGVDPCECGSDDLVLWLEQDQSFDHPRDSLDALQKIECCKCGNIVWSGCQEAIDDWNAHNYD